MIGDLVILLFALAAIPVGVLYLRKRRRENTGRRCWYCGHDLTRVPKLAGTAHPTKCPQCGNEVEADD